MLKAETVETLLPRFFIDIVNDSHITTRANLIDEAEKSRRKATLDGLREISIIIPSILARISHFPVAIVFINQAK